VVVRAVEHAAQFELVEALFQPRRFGLDLSVEVGVFFVGQFEQRLDVVGYALERGPGVDPLLLGGEFFLDVARRGGIVPVARFEASPAQFVEARLASFDVKDSLRACGCALTGFLFPLQ
jgi:hypothetical protein